METQKEYQAKRQHAKKLRVAYRDGAKLWLIGNQMTTGEYPITVNERSNVQPAEDGAFVECIMWVPRAAAEHLLQFPEKDRVTDVPRSIEHGGD